MLISRVDRCLQHPSAFVASISGNSGSDDGEKKTTTTTTAATTAATAAAAVTRHTYALPVFSIPLLRACVRARTPPRRPAGSRSQPRLFDRLNNIILSSATVGRPDIRVAKLQVSGTSVCVCVCARYTYSRECAALTACCFMYIHVYDLQWGYGSADRGGDRGERERRQRGRISARRRGSSTRRLPGCRWYRPRQRRRRRQNDISSGVVERIPPMMNPCRLYC